jgi:uncharacterized NAD(P)/FAD-binding protein YdhS
MGWLGQPGFVDSPTQANSMTDSPGRRRVVAIVGGGFSGAAVAFHLLQEPATGLELELVLVEPAPEPGRGLAYSTSCDSHRLNVPAGRLGIDPAHEGGFMDWLQAQGLPYVGSNFVPRRLLGAYAGGELERSARAAGAGVVFRHVRASVDAIARQRAPFELRLSDGSSIRADHVVLATGHLPPALPPGAQPVAWSDAGMVPDPWQADALARLPAAQDVLLVGSGLTAVDIVMQLRDSGHTGRIHLLSRRGMLPQPHRANETRPPVGLSSVELGNELRLRRIVSTVRAWIARTQAAGGDWRDGMASLRASTPRLWQRLSVRDRRQFLRHLLPFWDTHRHRFAAGIHLRLQSLLADGQVTLHAGRLDEVARREDGQLQVRWRPRGGGAQASVVVGRVVNCTGPTANLARAQDPLHASLRDAGILSADPLGQGLLVDACLQLVDASGIPVEGLYYVGPMLKAQRWEAVAIPELRVHARDVARRILQAA